uniref:Uncharacterized protein n=1 Tax=Lepeophtheirus salmonis TaxID=72036 RepID=A0A0K2TCB0_LEPSM
MVSFGYPSETLSCFLYKPQVLFKVSSFFTPWMGYYLLVEKDPSEERSASTSAICVTSHH